MLINRALNDHRYQAVALIAPALVVYCVFAIYPMLEVFALSFVKWNGLTTNKTFVGLSNYAGVLFADAFCFSVAAFAVGFLLSD